MPDTAHTPAPTSTEQVAGAPEDAIGLVVVTDPQGNEKTYALDRPCITFGRDESNHVCIRDKRCSRKHFVVEMAGDYYNAVDSGSTNKLRMQGRKLERRRLRDGDVIEVGEFKIKYRGPSDDDHPDELLDAPLVGSGKGGGKIKLDKKGDTIRIQDDIPSDPEFSPEIELPPEPAPDDGELAADDEPAAEGEPAAEAEAEPEPEVTPAPQEPEPVDDSVTCPDCSVPMPANAPCEQCGRKSLKLQAQENFVDKIARQGSILGGLGLWGLKRGGAIEKVFALENVDWVLDMSCERCGKRHRRINEFRILCITCDHCGGEIALPVQEVPKL